MEYSALMLGGILVVVVVALMIRMKRMRQENEAVANETKICETTGMACCGGGDNCPHKKMAKHKYIYYEDEELDRFRGRAPESYTAEEVEEWKEVFSTLHDEDREGWLASIKERGLELPAALR